MDRHTVLIVDDSEFDRSICSKMLSISFNLVVAKTLAEAKACLESHKIHCILLDYHLPDGEGMELLNYCRQGDLVSPPIIILSSAGDEELVTEVMKMGASDYLNKDVSSKFQFKLKSIVQSTIDNHSFKQSTILLKRQQRAILYAISNPVIGLSKEMQVIFINPSICRMLSVCSAEDITDIHEHLQFETRKEEQLFYQAIENALNAVMTPTIMVACRLKDGTLNYFDVVFSPIKHDNGDVEGVVCSFHDVTTSHQLSSKLQFQASHDPLTQLPNRLLLQDRLAQTIKYCRRRNTGFTILYCDLDGFKKINDTAGHATGDEALNKVCDRIKQHVRDSDTLARIGGDEFVIIYNDVEMREDVMALAEKILGAMVKPVIIRGQTHQLGVSIGIATFPDNGQEVDSLLVNADKAMYQAKYQGGNQYVFYQSDMHIWPTDADEMLSALSGAIENEQLSIVFQPQFNATHHTLFGFEVLTRWQHPELGYVNPSAFIQLAEEHALMPTLGRWIIEQALQTYQECIQKKLPDCLLSINITEKQIEDPAMLTWLINTFSEFQIPPYLISFEISESLLVRNNQTVYSQLLEMTQHGFKIVIDDYGTGQSSIIDLKKVPVTSLKIDNAIIREVETNPQMLEVITAITTMASTLKMDTIAEGVEDELQEDLLKQATCVYHQGNWYGRPIEREHLMHYINRFIFKRHFLNQ